MKMQINPSLLAGAAAVLAALLVAGLVLTMQVLAAWDRARTNLLQCPRCGRRDICPSRTGGMRDAILARFECAPFRCRECSKRFYRYHSARGPEAGNT